MYNLRQLKTSKSILSQGKDLKIKIYWKEENVLPNEKLTY